MLKRFHLNKLLFISFLFFVNSITAQDLFTTGVIEFNNKNFKEAAKIFEKVIISNPFEISPYQYLTNCYIELNEHDKAIALLEKTIPDFPIDTGLKMTLGQLYASKMEFKKAEKIVLEVLDLDKDNKEIQEFLAKIYLNMAIVDFQKRKFSDSLKSLNKANKYGFDGEEYYELKSNLYIQLSEFAKAEKTAKNGLEKFPDSDQLLVDYSLILISKEKYNQAIENLKPVWKRNPDNLQIGLQLARLYRTKNKIKEAFAIYDILVKKFPKERKIYNEMLDYFSAVGKEDQKREIYKSMEKEFPDDKEITYLKIKTYIAEKKDSIAIVEYKKFIEDNPKSLNAYVDLANIYKANGDSKAGIKLLEKALEKDIKDKKIYFLLGSFYEEIGESKKAIETYVEYSKIKPKDSEVYYAIGSVFHKLEKYQVAINSFKKSLKYKRNSPLVLFKLADSFDKTGDLESAKKYYKKAFVQNIIALQRTQQLVLEEINKTNNFTDFNTDDDSEKMEIFKENINNSDLYLIENLSNKEYLLMIDELLEKYPMSPLLYFYKGLYYERIGELNSALKFYKRVVERSSKVEDAHIHMAEIYYRKKNFKEAILSYKRALSINPQKKDIYRRLIEIFREDGKLNELCDEWKRLYESQPDNEILRNFLITALHKADRIEEARKIINNSEK